MRRRLEQAGYDVADGLQTLGSDEIGFLIKFIYKSNFLGEAVRDFHKTFFFLILIDFGLLCSARPPLSTTTLSSSTSRAEVSRPYPSCYTPTPKRSSSSISREIPC